MKTKLTLIAILALACTGKAFENIGGVGTFDFTVEEGATTVAYTQSTNGIRFSEGLILGDTIGGLFSGLPKDWSSYPTDDFGVILNLTGINPILPFSLELYDSGFNIVGKFQGSTFGIGLLNKFAPITLSEAPTLPWNDIVGLQFTWDAPGSIDVTWEGVGVVPETSTVTLLALAGIAFAGIMYRKRLRHRQNS